MKNCIKNSVFILMVMALFSCSSDDDNRNRRIDITEFIIQGEFYEIAPSVIYFSNNGIATLRSFDGENQFEYTYENNVLVIDQIGSVIINNDQIESYENHHEHYDFQYAKLVKKVSENQFAGKRFSGTVKFSGSYDNPNSTVTVTCIVQFNQSGTQYSFEVEDDFVDSFNNLSLTNVGNISGYYSWSNGHDLFYFENGSLLISKIITNYYDYNEIQYFEGILQLN